VLVVFAYGWFFDRVAQVKASSLEEIKRVLTPLEAKEQELQKHEGQVKSTKDQAEALIEKVRWRLFWPDILAELRTILMGTERSVEEARPGLRVGVWIENFGTAANPAGGTESTEENNTGPSMYRMDPRLLERYGLLRRRSDGEAEGAATATGAAPAKSTNELENIKVKFRALNLSKVSGDSSANGQLAFVVQNAIQSSPFFDKDGTKLAGDLEQAPDEHTFTFGMVLKLRVPGAPASTAARKK
jgi:hypothetical protein